MRVLWFDDEVEDVLGTCLVVEVANAGSSLTPIRVADESSLASAMQQVSTSASDFDLAVVDLRLDKVDGIRLMQELSAVWLGPIVVLTRYPKHDELRRFIDPGVDLIEIVKPDSQLMEEVRGWFASDFWPHVLSHFEVSRHARCRVTETADAARTFLTTSLRDLDSLSFSDQISLKTAASEPLARAFGDCFEDHDVSYAVVAAWPPRVVRVGRAGDEIPGVDSLRVYQRQYGGPAVVLRRPATVNMVSAAPGPACAPTAGPARGTSAFPDWFPTLQIELANKALEVHFDTGSDFSFLSYQRVGDAAPNREHSDYWNPMTLRVGLGEPRTLMVSEWNVNLRARALVGQLEHKIPMQLVLDFGGSGLSAECREHCPSFVVSADGMDCQFRAGLLGRDLLRYTGWVFVADTVRQRAFVVRHDDGIFEDGATQGSGRLRSWFDRLGD